jgi:hypothetical protein
MIRRYQGRLLAECRIAPVRARFTEGFEKLDLKKAKALLDELHA